jgi:intracellular multiplication protein IcmT
MLKVNMYAPNVGWRDTARTPRLGFVDARISYAVLIFCFHISMATFVIVVMAALVFGIVERLGYSFEVLLRRLRIRLVGRRRIAVDPLVWRRNLNC